MKLFELFDILDTPVNEGGNVFKDNPTVRINKEHVLPTVQWLEKHLNIPLADNMLGSTGRKPTSGDLDLAVDSNIVSKDELFAKLQGLANQIGMDPATSVRKSGVSVHFPAPIQGGGEGLVQVDFMFMGDVEWGKFQMSTDAGKFTGRDRAQVLAALAKHNGFKITKEGLVVRDSNKPYTKDLDKIATTLIGPKASADDLYGVELMVAALKRNGNKESLQAAVDSMEQNGVNITESFDPRTGHGTIDSANLVIDSAVKACEKYKKTHWTIAIMNKGDKLRGINTEAPGFHQLLGNGWKMVGRVSDCGRDIGLEPWLENAYDDAMWSKNEN